MIIADNTVQGTHQAGIGIIPFEGNGNTRNVVIRGNHVDGVGLYGEAADVLWGAGTPYGIAVGNPSDSLANMTVDSVLVEGNLVADCRNGYLSTARANDVKVSGNHFYGPIVTEQPAPGSPQQAGSGAGAMAPPLAPFSGGSTPVFPAIRARRAKRVRVDNNVVRPATNERSVLVEGSAVADVVRSRVTDNTFDRGTSPPLGVGGVDEIAFHPAGIVVYQGGNDINGLAIAPTNTPA